MTIEEIIAIVLLILAGLFIIGLAIYTISVNSRKNWAETTAKVVGRHHYVTPNPPSHSRAARPAYREGYEKEIEYTVDGRIYKKYVSDSYEDSLKIYYKKNNPDFIRTEKEGPRGHNSIAVFMIIFGIAFIAAAIMLIK